MVEKSQQIIGLEQSQQQKINTSIIMNSESLSQQNTELIRQFKRQMKYLQYPVLIKNTNISARSLLQFFYEVQPNKNLSLKLENLFRIQKIDLFIISSISNQQNQAASLQQDLLCKQLVEIYDLINIDNLHKYIKNPYTLDNYILSNGHIITSVIYLSPILLQNLTNRYPIPVLNVLFNLYNIQDILNYNIQDIYRIIEVLESIQINKGSGYQTINIIKEKEHIKLSELFDNSLFTISRFQIQNIYILFTNMTKNELNEYVSKNDKLNDIMFLLLTDQMCEIQQQIYIAKLNNIIITNIFSQFNTIQYGQQSLQYQFDLNSIYFLFRFQIQYRYLLDIDCYSLDINMYIKLLQQIEIPKQFTLKHKLRQTPILRKSKYLIF